MPPTYYPNLYAARIDPVTYQRLATVLVVSVTGDTATVIGAGTARYQLPCRELRASWDRLHETYERPANAR